MKCFKFLHTYKLIEKYKLQSLMHFHLNYKCAETLFSVFNDNRIFVKGDFVTFKEGGCRLAVGLENL